MISRCQKLLSGDLTRKKVEKIISILKTFDLSKATDEEVSEITVILKENDNQYFSDDIINYLIFLIDNIAHDNSVKKIMKEFRNYTEQIQKF